MANETCPSESRLRQFLRGELGRAELEVVGSHLESCALCESVAETLEEEGHSLAEGLLGAVLTEPTVAEQSGQSGRAGVREDRPGRSGAIGQEASVGQGIGLGHLEIAGRYRLLEKVGEGGMGEVWVADQFEPVKRRVAVKLIKPGMNSRAILARFEQERQALAIMDHPNIARVLDGGVTAAGQPFFVMEMVDGLPLTRFCDEARLTTDERLELFVLICQAVQHAHQKGVVHRDLKPSNVLVTRVDGKPAPRVIDFGVAKAIDTTLLDRSLFTQTGGVVGTLEYMAPEQTGLSGTDIDTRADIYSLGVILYELLTGRRPIDIRREKPCSAVEMIRLIQEQEPATPSTNLSTNESLPEVAALRQTEPRRLVAQLRGELDWVVMKCLEKERDRRYETSSALARDIERYLADEPVEARPASRGYRFQKFLSRNQGGVIAASLIALAVVTGTGAVIAVQAKANGELRAANERVRARFDLAREAIRSFQDAVNQDEMLREGPLKGLRNTLLRSAAGFYEKLEKLLEDQSDRGSRAVLAQTYFELGELTAGIGVQPEALGVHRKGLALRRELAAAMDAAGVDKLDLARSLLANGRLASATGDSATGLRCNEEALELSRSMVTGEHPTAEARQVLATSYQRVGFELGLKGQTDKALESYGEALAIWEGLLREQPKSAEFLGIVGQIHRDIGALQSTTGRIPDALGSYQRALAIEEVLVREYPGVARYKFSLATVHNVIGNLESRTSQVKEALQSYEKSMKLREELVHDYPAVTEYRRSLARILNNIGLLQSKTGRLDQAQASLRRALQLNEELVRENPAVTELAAALASSHNFLGNVLADMMRTEDALQSYQEALKIRERLARENPTVVEFETRLAGMHYNIGLLLSESGKTAEASKSYREGILLLQTLTRKNRSIADNRRLLSDCENRLAGALRESGRTTEALRWHQEAQTTLRELVRDNPADVEFRSRLAINQTSIGELRLRTGQTAEAMESFRAALAIQRELVRDNPTFTQFRSDLSATHEEMGMAAVRSGRIADGLDSHRQALSIRSKLADENPSNPSYQGLVADSHTACGDALRLSGRTNESIAEYDRAIQIIDRLMRANPGNPGLMAELGAVVRRKGLARSAGGDMAGAVVEERKALASFEKGTIHSAEEFFEFACARSALVKLARNSGSGVSADEADTQADRAIEDLRAALANGYRDVEEITMESSLEPLRDRADFRALMMDMVFPESVFVEQAASPVTEE